VEIAHQRPKKKQQANGVSRAATVGLLGGLGYTMARRIRDRPVYSVVTPLHDAPQ
jgi:hypothetical protein